MKWLGLLLFAVLLAEVAAQIATPPPPQSDPFVGTWQEKQGQNVVHVRTIERNGDELVFSSRSEDLKPKEHNYRIRCDGALHPVPFGSMSCEYAALNVVDGESRYKNNHIEYWRREVSADGQEMLISGYTDSGRAMKNGSNVLRRLKTIAVAESKPTDSDAEKAPQAMCDAAAPKLRKAGTNEVVLMMTLDGTGQVTSFKTESPKGLRLEKMNEAATAIKTIHFKPKKNGPVVVQVEIAFDCADRLTSAPKSQ
jgi:hypothetical protein